MVDERLKHIAAEIALGLTTSQQIRSLALQLTAEDLAFLPFQEIVESPGLNYIEAEEMLARILDEFGVEVPNQREAALYLTGEICQEIIDGIVSPYEGARRITKLQYGRVSFELILEMHPFVYVELCWDERPKDHKFLEGAIIGAARTFLQGPE